MFSAFSVNGSMNGMNKKKIVQGLLLVSGISMSIGLIGVEGAYSKPSNVTTTKDTRITEIRRQLARREELNALRKMLRIQELQKQGNN